MYYRVGPKQKCQGRSSQGLKVVTVGWEGLEVVQEAAPEAERAWSSPRRAGRGPLTHLSQGVTVGLRLTPGQ